MSRNCFRVVVPMSRAALAKKLTPAVAYQPARSILSLRRSPFNQLSPFDDAFRQMDRQFQRMERDMNNLMENVGFLRPFAGAGRFLSPPVSMESELLPEGEGAPSKYTLNIAVGDVPPENIKISLKDREMTIEAKIEQKSEDGTSRVYQEIMRKFTLPENINLKEVKSILTPDGILKIEAPLPESEAVKPKEIPIETHEAVEIDKKVN